jgi:RimJ/RimL family protein N-acetyltransferase
MVQAVAADGGRNAEIAWAVGVPRQGQGIASEAAHAVVAWLEAHGVHTITAHINPGHHASVRVATRVGLYPTGEVREQRGSASNCGGEGQCRRHCPGSQLSRGRGRRIG